MITELHFVKYNNHVRFHLVIDEIISRAPIKILNHASYALITREGGRKKYRETSWFDIYNQAEREKFIFSIKKNFNQIVDNSLLIRNNYQLFTAKNKYRN